MKTHLRPYVGITGFATAPEVEALRRLPEALHLHERVDGYELAVGVLVSNVTLAGGPAPMPRYPELASIAPILADLRTIARPVLHYNSRSDAPLDVQLADLLARTDCFDADVCRRVQLNVATPAVGALEAARRAHPGLELVLQVPLWREDLRRATELLRFVSPYAGVVDYVLLDPSGGRGAGADDALIGAIAEASGALAERFGIVLAGGLGPANTEAELNRFRRALGEVPFSVDAEGKLRGGAADGKRVGDRLNATKMGEYLRAAAISLGSGSRASDTRA